MLQQEKDTLVNIQGSVKRMWSGTGGEDGKALSKFIEHMAGITDFVPSARLELVEGLKRFNVMLNKMLNMNQEQFLEWYDKTGRNIFSN